MRPFHARGLVTDGLLGAAAQVAAEDLLRCHGAVESLLADGSGCGCAYRGLYTEVGREVVYR
jgi:hypothetical protein